MNLIEFFTNLFKPSPEKTYPNDKQAKQAPQNTTSTDNSSGPVGITDYTTTNVDGSCDETDTSCDSSDGDSDGWDGDGDGGDSWDSGSGDSGDSGGDGGGD